MLSLRVTGPTGSEKIVFRNEILPEFEARDYDVDRVLLDGGYNVTMLRDEIIEKLHAVPLVPWAKNS